MVELIAVVDDDVTVSDALRIILERAGHDVDVFSSAEEFLSSDITQWDCVITDVRMPGLSGLKLQEELARRQAHFPIIVMTGFADVPVAINAMKAGAIDFLEKPFNSENLLKSVVRALDVGRHAQKRASAAKKAQELLARLTLRETEVMTKLVEGMSNKEAARELGISPRTVELHRAKIMEKCAAHNLADIARIYLAAA